METKTKCFRIEKVYFPDGEIGFECLEYVFYNEKQHVYGTYEEAQARGIEYLEEPIRPPLTDRQSEIFWEYREIDAKVVEMRRILDNWGEPEYAMGCSKEQISDQFDILCKYRHALRQRQDVKDLIALGYIGLDEEEKDNGQ